MGATLMALGRTGRCWDRRTAKSCWPISPLSCLLHDGLGAANLPLDLLPRPASSFNGARLELPVRPRLLNHGRDPFLPESISQLAIGIRICEITTNSQSS